ncbi:hypothetical protein ABZ027_41940 [Streptomyces sp. NPDC006332]|uniref:hypothetical protein n=1 Tax=Streptomyces sp. NPDC006332 TaxID=3155456 RepID=UPI0033BA7956
MPDELGRATSLIGPRGYVAERVAEFAACGVTTLRVGALADGVAERVAAVEALRDLI